MESQSITLPLELEDVRVVAQRVTATHLEVEVERTPPSARCPTCGHHTAKRHDARPRRLLDRPLGPRMVVVILHRRRFRCWACRRLFTEPDAIAAPRRRLTERVRQQLGYAGCRQPMTTVAAQYGVSPTTVARAVEEYAAAHLAARPPAVVERLGIDEFSLRRGRRYATGLHDLTTHRLIEVVEGRTATVAQRALERLAAPERVQVVSMDMARAYRAAVHLVLPQAAIVADKFHVSARVHEAVAQVLARLLQGRSRDDPLRQDGRLVLRGRESLTPPQWRRLRPLLWQYPDLRRAWLLKEDFRRWYRTTTLTAAVSELGAWRRMALAPDSLPEFRALARMLREWAAEIVAYFEWRVTQAAVEGRHTRVKLLQRQACGYRRFASLRTRLLVPT